MNIRSATPDDVAVIAQLLNEVDHFYGDELTDTAEQRSSAIRQALFSVPPLAKVLLAEDDGRAVGFATYSSLWPASGSTASLYLKELYVVEEYRGSGVGRLLISELCRVAVQSGMSRLELTTDRANEDARRFYARLGISVNDRKVMYRVDGEQLSQLGKYVDRVG